MSVGRIASRYAKSLIDLATEKGIAADVMSDMETLNSAIESRDFKLLLKSPIVPGPKKKEILEAIFKGKVSDLSLLFFIGTVNKGRERYLDAIADEYILQYRSQQGISSVTLTTAKELSAGALDGIKAKLNASVNTDKNIELETIVDEKLLGGFIVQFGDRRYDASVANKILNLKKEFDTNLYIKRI